jgi:actin-related protein
MNAAAIGFVPAPLMNVITMNAKTALVIDTGINECLFYPVFDRVVLWQEFDATPCSTLMVENRIRELMKVHGRVQTKDGKERSMNDKDLKLFDDLDCAEDICHRFCFATTRERSLEMQTNIGIVF